MRTKKIIQRGLIGILVLAMAGALFAESKKEERKERKVLRSTTKEITGEVSAVSKNFIAIVYQRDKAKGIEYEMGLPIEDKPRLERIKEIGEIKEGDTVTVEYEEAVVIGEEGKELTQRRVKGIKLVRPALKKPEVFEPETEVLISE